MAEEKNVAVLVGSLRRESLNRKLALALAGLAPAGKTHVQLQEDIVLQPRTVVTEYVHQTAYCPGCRREVFATADGELRNCSIGPVTQAAAVYLRHEVKLFHPMVHPVRERPAIQRYDGLIVRSAVWKQRWLHLW